MSKILQNAVFVPSQDKFFKSMHTHDYVSFVAGGKNHFIDGGNDYFRASLQENNPDILDYRLSYDDSLEEIQEKLLWGTYGKKGDQPLTWKLISSLEKDHLKAILETQPVEGLVRNVVKFWFYKQ